MPVDKHTTTILFCEGKPDSLDYLMLTEILPLGLVRIQPVGGKHSLPAYIRGYMADQTGMKQPIYLAFRDRDFDIEPSTTPELMQLRPNQPIWMCHRAAIENYLIDAELIREYWTHRETAPGWSHGPAKTVVEIEADIRQSGVDLIDYQAVRWALAKIKPGLRWPEIRTTWTKGSGYIPSALNHEDCIGEARKLLSRFKDQIQGVSIEALEKFAEDFRRKFTEKRFIEDHKHCIWFHGKDLLKLLCGRLSPSFPRKNYSYWAAQHINPHKHSDLNQLTSMDAIVKLINTK